MGRDFGSDNVAPVAPEVHGGDLAGPITGTAPSYGADALTRG